MVHKQEYQRLADVAARELGGYALHVGKIGETTFVYALRKGDSRELGEAPTLITVDGADTRVLTGEAAVAVEGEMTPRTFATGRAIFKGYETMVKNHSYKIGQTPGYAESIVDALKSKAVGAVTMYQYLELADHNRLTLSVEHDGADTYLTLH